MTRSPVWYARRLSRMTLEEVLGRSVDHGRQLAWARHRVPLGAAGAEPRAVSERSFHTTLPEDAWRSVEDDVGKSVVQAADALLDGRWSVLGVMRRDVLDPDWFLDPISGRRAPQDRLCFAIDHRDEAVTGNVKSVWELSRHHHLTVLASAYWLTRDDKYAELVAAQLRSWWRENPFLTGIHWTSGIELGVRLVSWVWIRRLLDSWSGVASLFEGDPWALRQIYWHQRFLAAFPSRGSSANNHAVAEACGQLVAACAFPWFGESDRWRDDAGRRLAAVLQANTFDSGVNRELASDYHRFVAELGLVALAEANACGHRLPHGLIGLLTSSVDAAAALLDGSGRPPRQGDGDEGRALVVDNPDREPWHLLLGAGAAIVGPLPWWPDRGHSVTEVVLGALGARDGVGTVCDRPAVAPTIFGDAGITLLKSPPGHGPELWVRCDGGPHGFLSIAAHAHADALSLELRCDGVELLVDPGTYCYHGEPEWRDYFRSTVAHNTLEIDGKNQSVAAGPFMWSSHAVTQQLPQAGGVGDVVTWGARHLGYTRLGPGLVHARTVEVDGRRRRITIDDTVAGGHGHRGCLFLHLGPEVESTLHGSEVNLSWQSEDAVTTARLLLPPALRWTTHRGETHPILGWYSPRFGQRIPTTTLLGEGDLSDDLTLRTVLEMVPHG